nr:MAG: hypothetical protein [Microvirus sp.]
MRGVWDITVLICNVPVVKKKEMKLIISKGISILFYIFFNIFTIVFVIFIGSRFSKCLNWLVFMCHSIKTLDDII